MTVGMVPMFASVSSRPLMLVEEQLVKCQFCRRILLIVSKVMLDSMISRNALFKGAASANFGGLARARTVDELAGLDTTSLQVGARDNIGSPTSDRSALCTIDRLTFFTAGDDFDVTELPAV